MAKKKEAPVETPSYTGVVETIVGNADSKGGVTQVRVKVLDGPDANKIIIRNVRGPVKLGDVIVMTETEYEARRVYKKQRQQQKW